MVPLSGAGLLFSAADSADVRVPLLVVRDPRTAVAALMRAWESRQFALDPQPEGWWGDPWSFDLIDDWRELLGRPLAEVCARQWLTLMLQALQVHGDRPVVSFEELVTDPRAAEQRISGVIGEPVQVALDEPGDAWFMAADRGEVLAGLMANEALFEQYLTLVEARGIPGYRDQLPMKDDAPVDGRQSSVGSPFHAAYTTTVAQLLAQAESSLLITTYKAGQVILARTEDGEALDTHLTAMNRPMGTAVAGNRLAIGAADSVVTYARHDAGAKVGVLPVPDAVMVPKAVCFTGDVAIHDMGWDADGTLWFVNTRFSCLSTLNMHSSFDVRWKPQWISAIAGEDRCHLNGLAMVDGHPRFVTALARTDEAGGWREHKGTAGVIVDITTDQVIAEGLSMPHSPRWHDGALWFLQSGTGSLNVLDTGTGQHREITRLPGFTRGLAFIGPYALVGLSQVRESVFTGLPVTESADERNCGVWAVDTRSGEIVGFVRFTGTVTEIFDVQVLPARWPHIGEPGDLTASSFALDPNTIALMNPASDY
jgi:uncharacterized protein (TIGR03032 family)